MENFASRLSRVRSSPLKLVNDNEQSGIWDAVDHFLALVNGKRMKYGRGPNYYTLTVDETSALWDIVTELKKIGEVNVEGSKAIVCCVGDNLRNIPGVPHMAFSALQDIKIQMISQGASAINITFVIDQERLPEAVRNLHDSFFRKIDRLIFE